MLGATAGMSMTNVRHVILSFSVCLGLISPGLSAASGQGKQGPALPELHHPILWHDPGQIADLNVFRGPGGQEGLPVPPFTFEQEDRSGKTSRFYAHDGAGRHWTVEAGRDARPEVAASRLLWAAGYLTDDDYVIWKANVAGLQLRSSKRYVRGGSLYDTRFSRRVDGQTKVGTWQWRKNPFTGTRELNGLRVMMALLNCWDLKDDNNPVIKDLSSGSEQFRVSGLGASLGKTGPRLFRGKAQDNASSFARSGFITKRTDTYVDFATPARSFNPLALFSRKSSPTWIGRRVPRKDAKWVGAILGQLSHKQIEDAFWAAGYPANEVNLFANVVDARIRALGDL
ncbi:MAG: hypothetical protein NVSMB62_02900 [Acidobacteriaceae bacterium]